jgi:phytoene dehydrogenase-like protein
VSDYDVIVAGGGHNGLVCAAYLARGGQRVAVLERRSEVGGIAEVLHTAGRLQAGVIADLDLAGHGLELIRPDVRMAALREDAPALTFWADPERTAEGLRASAPADAEAYPGFDAYLRELAGFVAEVQASTPPRLDRAALGDAAAGLRLARAYRRLGPRAARELTRVLPMAAADLVGEWFTHDAVRAALAVRGTQFTAMGPWSAGTALVLLSDSAGNDGGAAGQTAFARGGPAALALALSRAARAAGADVRTGAEVAQVLARDGRIEGVELASGEQITAPTVACAVDPKTVLTSWLDPVLAGPRMRWRAGNIRTPGATARLDLTLTALPAFTGVDGDESLHGRLVFAPGIDAVEQAFDAWKYGRVSEWPYLEATIPTLHEPGAAGTGQRMTVLAQWVPYAAEPDEVAERVLAVLERHAPGIGGLVAATAVLTPAAIEREYGLAGGHLYHAEPALDQFFAWRPVIGLARHRLGVPGLYLCGAGAHPGGGITGGPGRNAVREILRDLRRAG